MTNRTYTRLLSKVLYLGALLAAAGLVLVACGGSDQGSVEQGGGQEEEQAGGTGAAETTGTAGMESTLEQASKFPEAMQSAEGGNQRFRGSQDVPFEDFVGYVINDSNAKWQSVLTEAGVPYAPTIGVLFEQSAAVPEGCGTDETGTVAEAAYGPFYCPFGPPRRC